MKSLACVSKSLRKRGARREGCAARGVRKRLRKGVAQGGGKLVKPNQQILVCAARSSFMRLRKGVAQDGVDKKGCCDVELRPEAVCKEGCRAHMTATLPGGFLAPK